MMRIVDRETGLPLEAAKRLRQLEMKTEPIRIDEDSKTSIGSPEQPVAQVIASEITITSLRELKTGIHELTESELDIQLPAPKSYKIDGREKIGFIEDELPEKIRRPGGYSLDELVAILAYKVSKLEREASSRRDG